MDLIHAPRPGDWALVVAPHAGSPLMLDLAAQLACRGPVSVLDGGDRFKAHTVARSVRRYLSPGAGGSDFTAALERIRLARAFTCYQMVTLLDDSLQACEIVSGGRPGLADGGLPPSPPAPTLVLDLLATFYDESVPLAESQRLLDICLAYLGRMAAHAPLAVSVRPPRPSADRQILVECLAAKAVQVYHLELTVPPKPPRLF